MLGCPLCVVVGPVPDVRVTDHVRQVLEVLLVNVPAGAEIILKFDFLSNEHLQPNRFSLHW